MSDPTLGFALAQRQAEYRRIVNRLRDEDVVTGGDVEALREAIELAGCLRRLLPGRTVAEIHLAFGAPGDFGYETPIGDALSRLYRGEGSL